MRGFRENRGATRNEKVKYTQEKKEHALALMSAPKNQPVVEVSRQTGVPEATLYLWRKQAKNAGRTVPGDGANPEQWSGADKLPVVLGTAPLGEAELSQYCRRRGLHVEQVVRWRDEALCLAHHRPEPGRLHLARSFASGLDRRFVHALDAKARMTRHCAPNTGSSSAMALCASRVSQGRLTFTPACARRWCWRYSGR